MERAKASRTGMPRNASKQKQRGGYQFSGPVENKRTDFYKLIHIGIIREEQLGLPSGFVKKHEHELPGVISLTVPTGDSWTVKLRKAHGRICFAGGWKDFVDHHSIHVGHVLFFSYDGHATFEVNICDMTTAEIDYPRKTEKSEVPINAIDEGSEKMSLENERHHKGKENIELGEPCTRHDGIMTPYWSSRAFYKNSLWVQKNSATEAGQKHESEHPSFLVVMQPSYVEETFALNVPAKFLTKYLGTETRNVTLRLPDGASQGREWIARCNVYSKNVVKIYDWKAFAEDNGLRIYDVCVFELQDRKRADFTVYIYRNEKEVPQKVLTSDDSPYSVEKKGRSRTYHQPAKLSKKQSLQKNFPFKSDYPFFLIKLAPTYVKQQYLHLPTSFVAEHLPEKSTHARIVDSDGRAWFMNYNIVDSTARLSDGWDSVVTGYNLREHSVCAFELIDGQTILLKMTILKL